jgi:hypothetical protein
MVSNRGHFYIDHAPPDGVRRILRVLPLDSGLTVREIGIAVPSSGTAKFRSEWPKRLADLGLALVDKNSGPLRYKLSPLGMHVQQLEYTRPSLIPDVLHYLHSEWSSSTTSVEYIWSYQTCCDIIWREKRLLDTRDIAAQVLESMHQSFPDLNYQARVGARFDKTAAGRWLQWVKFLEPSPFPDESGVLHPRSVTSYELILLALDRIYRQRGYRYGDPVLLDETLLDRIAAVFFLDLTCCRNLLEVAARLTRSVRLADTLAGTAITLQEPYTIERI